MFVNPGSRGLGRTYTTTTSCNRRERMYPGGDTARDNAKEMRIEEELTSAQEKLVDGDNRLPRSSPLRQSSSLPIGESR